MVVQFSSFQLGRNSRKMRIALHYIVQEHESLTEIWISSALGKGYDRVASKCYTTWIFVIFSPWVLDFGETSYWEDKNRYQPILRIANMWWLIWSAFLLGRLDQSWLVAAMTHVWALLSPSDWLRVAGAFTQDAEKIGEIMHSSPRLNAFLILYADYSIFDDRLFSSTSSLSTNESIIWIFLSYLLICLS